METKAISKRLDEFKVTNPFTKYAFPKDHKIMISEGCKLILDKLKATWLFDMILFFQLARREQLLSFQMWTLNRLPDGRIKMTCEDESGSNISSYSVQEINFFTDELKFIVNDGYIAIYEEIYYDQE